jgi:hypothetical protein
MNPGDDLLPFLSEYLPPTYLFLVEDLGGAHDILSSFILLVPPPPSVKVESLSVKKASLSGPVICDMAE